MGTWDQMHCLLMMGLEESDAVWRCLVLEETSIRCQLIIARVRPRCRGLCVHSDSTNSPHATSTGDLVHAWFGLRILIVLV